MKWRYAERPAKEHCGEPMASLKPLRMTVAFGRVCFQGKVESSLFSSKRQFRSGD
jgi:hypothetical protein